MLRQFNKLIDTVLFKRAKSETYPTKDDASISSTPNTHYWTKHTVTGHLVFRSREHSLQYLAWRNSQYLFYEDLMPLDGHDGEIILDYGCGPGNDMVGFAEFSRPQRIIGYGYLPISAE